MTGAEITHAVTDKRQSAKAHGRPLARATLPASQLNVFSSCALVCSAMAITEQGWPVSSGCGLVGLLSIATL